MPPLEGAEEENGATNNAGKSKRQNGLAPHASMKAWKGNPPLKLLRIPNLNFFWCGGRCMFTLVTCLCILLIKSNTCTALDLLLRHQETISLLFGLTNDIEEDIIILNLVLFRGLNLPCIFIG